MKRQLLIKIHLCLSAFFAPFLLLMAITGTCYLLGFKGSTKQEIVSSIAVGDNTITKNYISSHIKKMAPDYSFEYIKEKPGVFYTRPTTRTFYKIKKEGQSSYVVYKVTPNFLASIIEVHKGHGPSLLKTLQKVLGFILMLILITGVWLALQLKRDQKMTLVLIGAGFILLSIMILFL